MLSREVPIDPAHAALLFVDVQNYNARPDGGEYAAMTEAERDARYGYFFRTMRETALPNMQRLQAACRHAGIEVMYTVIEALTRDGRDLSLDYKISGLFVPRGSWDAKVLDAIAPGEDEIVLPKTSSSVFISTNIDYVLRNLGVRSLMIAGVLTDQCIEFGGARCVRSGVPGDGAHRRLRHAERGTTRVGAAQQPWLLPAGHDGRAGAGDRQLVIARSASDEASNCVHAPSHRAHQRCGFTVAALAGREPAPDFIWRSQRSVAAG